MFYYILFFLFSLGQIGRVSLFNQSISFYLYEVILLGFIFYLFLRFKLKPFGQKDFIWLYKFPLALLLSFLITLDRYSIGENTTALLYLFRTSFYFISIMYLHYFVKKQKDLYEYIRPGLLFFTVLTLIFSFLQYFLYPNLRNLTYLGWDPHLFRIFGVFFDTSIASAVFGLIILFLILNYRKFKFSNFSKIVLIVSFFVIGLLTYSRGFYLAILSTLFLYLIINKRLKYLIVILGLFSFALLILPKPFGEGVNLLRTYSIESRVKDYNDGLIQWKKSPVFGIGYNHLRSIRTSDSGLTSHSASAYQSSFLTVLVTSGIIGLVSFLLAVKSLWKFSLASRYYILFVTLFSLMDNILLHPYILFLLLFLINDS